MSVREFALRKILLEQLRHQAPQALAVVRFHVNEFHADPVGGDVAHHGRGLDFSHPRADFQLQGVADRQTLLGFQKRSAQGDDAHARGRGSASR